MSDKVRGRALIININKFKNTSEERGGSDVDYDNISQLFKDLWFDVVKTQEQLTDLSAQVCMINVM